MQDPVRHDSIAVALSDSIDGTTVRQRPTITQDESVQVIAEGTPIDSPIHRVIAQEVIREVYALSKVQDGGTNAIGTPLISLIRTLTDVSDHSSESGTARASGALAPVRLLDVTVRATLFFAGVVGGMLVAGAASAQSVELNFGTVNDPGGMQHRSAVEWASRVNDALGEQGKVEVFGSSQLGSDKEMLQKLKLGTLDFSQPSTIMSTVVPEFGLFDMPYLNGMDLREVALEERRAALNQVLEADESELLRYSADFTDQPESMLESACQMKLEGLIGKRAGSTYVSRRSNSWVKIKCNNRQEFVIVGYTDPKGARSGFGALLLGLHDKQGQLLYAGKVGTGFNHATLESLHAKLKPLEVDKSPLAKAPPAADVRGAHWLKPELMCEVAYAEMTRQGVVRHSVFHGLRSDKPAKAITHERAAKAAKATGTAKAKNNPAPNTAGGKIKISNPERIIDKSIGATKIELARFYAEVAPWALPHLSKRPLALVRAPEGIDGELFFQKHTEKLSIPHVTQLDTSLFPNHAALMTIDTAEALVSAAQMGTIELHTWNAVAPVLDHPDRFVLDLDPDPALPWKRMLEATQLTQTLLDEIGLQSYLKTSGGKGLHIIVPLKPVHNWKEVKAFSQAIAQYMAKLMPQHFSAVSGPKNRVGRIFIDYLRNSKGASTVAAYSVRAREGLAVSVPIHRDELADLKGANIWTIRNLIPRLEEQGDDDPWAGIDEADQQITDEMRDRIAMK